MQVHETAGRRLKDAAMGWIRRFWVWLNSPELQD